MRNTQEDKAIANQGRIGLKFNIEKDKHFFAYSILKNKGRKKSAYLANLIWDYEKGTQTERESLCEDLSSKGEAYEVPKINDDELIDLPKGTDIEEEIVDLGEGEFEEHDDKQSFIMPRTEEQDSYLSRELIMNNLRKIGLT